ncbi:MAG: radical SAM protein [Rhodothermaceae bacterium]
MIREVTAKTILSDVKQPDQWFGLRYNMNLYRGCQHGCIYCDSRSECYRIEKFDEEVVVKTNAIQLLKKEIAKKKEKGTIGLGSMNDPYMPVELELEMTKQALEVIANHRFPVHMITKSDLVLRDLDLYKRINFVYAAISFTITTADDNLAKKIEPAAPAPSKRFKAMEKIAANGIMTGITLMPLLPYIQDNVDNIVDIVKAAKDSGVSYIIPAFGVTLRDRQRDYFYKKLEKEFPGIKERYIKKFKNNYFCLPEKVRVLDMIFREQCYKQGIPVKIKQFTPGEPEQLALF